MKYKINKQLIIENALAAANAAFLNGGNIAAEDIHKDAAGNKIAHANTLLNRTKNVAIQNATSGNVMDDVEKVKAERLMASAK